MPTATDADLKLLFTEARTHFVWNEEPVSDEMLKALYELTKWGPTSANTTPMRLVFVKTAAAKERLKPAISPFNVEKTMTAPVTAIIAEDTEFYEQLPKLFPSRGEAMKGHFASQPAERQEKFLLQNVGLQAGYFILAARALGLDAGPMAGFEREKVDAAFFPDGKWKTQLLINLGYGDITKVFPRLPRLSFEEAARIE